MRPFLVTIRVTFRSTSRCPTVIFFTIVVNFLWTSSHQLTSPFPFLHFTSPLPILHDFFLLHSAPYFIASLRNFETLHFSIPLLHEFIYFARFHTLWCFSLLYFASSSDSANFCSSWVLFLCTSSSSWLPFHFIASLDFAQRPVFFAIFYFSSYSNKCRMFICAMSLSTTLDIYTLLPIDLKPSNREGCPYKALVGSHSPRWEVFIDLTFLTEQCNHL